MASLFEADIASLKGVGPKRAELFRKLGAPTVGDLLRLYPRAYEDWRDAVPIRNTLLNEVNIVKGTVLRRPVEQRIRGGMTLYKTTITDGEDDKQLTFFNNRYITSLLTEGAVYAFRGKVTGTFMRREIRPKRFPRRADDSCSRNCSSCSSAWRKSAAQVCAKIRIRSKRIIQKSLPPCSPSR